MISFFFQRFRPLLSVCACALTLSAIPSEAFAQTTKPTIAAIDRTQIRRKQPRREANNFPYWVSHEDCIADDVLTFKVQVTRPNTDQFEVWAGTADCTQKNERQGATANCWRLYSKNVVKSPADIPIRAQDLVAQHSVVNGGGLDVPGTAEDCKPKYQNTGLYFMYINDAGDVSSNTVKFSETGVDTEGPITPDITELLPSDGRLIVKWSNNNPTEFAGYRLYCARASQTATSDNALTLLDGAVIDGSVLDGTGLDGTGLDATGLDATGLDMIGSDSAPVGVGDTASARSDAGTSGNGNTGGVGVPGCGGDALMEGTFPPATALCGEVLTFSTTTGYATGLTNGGSYAVGMTAVDRLGNESYLSNVLCNSPRNVYTFYEDYKDAGGGGGGGFCSVSTAPPRNAWPVWGLLSFALCLGLLRRINNT